MPFLTPKQNLVLKALKEYHSEFNRMPTLREFRMFLAKRKKLVLKNVRSVVQYLEALEEKGFILRGSGPRQIRLSEWKQARFLRIPVIGWISAGDAAAIPQDSITGYLNISQGFLSKILSRIGRNLFAVEVDGDSMNQKKLNGKAIEDGDFLIVNSRPGEFQNGDIVVANIGGALTVKEFRRADKNTVILLPRSDNPIHKPVYLTRQDEFLIFGKVEDVYKKF